MARIRTIKPEFWTSPQVVECSTITRLLFIGLWNFCDDAGIHPANIRQLKMRIFPADDISTEEIREMVFQLEAVGLLIRYEVEEIEYLQVTGWHHQRIDKATMRFPGPEKGTLVSSSTRKNSKIDQRELFDHSTTESKGRESKGEETRARALNFDSEFNSFWEIVVHKVGRGAARTSFVRRRREGVTLATLIDGFKSYIATKPPDHPWCNPATWLNQERYLDQPAGGATATKPADLNGWHPVALGTTDEDRAKWQACLDRAATLDRALTKSWLAGLTLDRGTLRAATTYTADRLRGGDLANFLADVGAGEFEIATTDE